MVTFEPVLTANGLTHSYKITLGHKKFNVLVDLGWDSNLSLDLQPCVAALAHVDLILLTHATVHHLGAFSFLYKTVPELRKIPVYCTYPVMALGKLVTAEAYRSAGLAGPFKDPILTVEDIEESFNGAHLIKYSQSINLARHGLEGLYITGYNSGHTLGGTLWKLKSALDSLLIAMDWNHSKDTHLNGGFLATGGKVNEQLVKPQVLITTANVSKSSLKKSRTEFCEDVQQVLRNGGTVLVPTSPSRALELILTLDSLGLKVPLLFASGIAKKLLSQANTMLEWMVTTIINDWQVKNESPFETSKFKCLAKFEDLKNYSDEPKVVLCTDECLELGYARRVFAEIAKDPKNAVILTQASAPNTLAAALTELWSKKGLAPISGDIPLKISFEEPLTGSELKKYNAKIEDQEKQANAEAALEKRNQAILEQAEEESSSDEDDPMQAEYTDPSGDLGPTTAFIYNDVVDYTLEGDKDVICQFPYIPHRAKTDDYGEILKPGQFESADGDADVEMKAEDGGDPGSTTAANKPEPRKPREKPMKITTREELVKLSCLVNHVDLNGLTDTRSLAMILNQIKPQNTVIIPGNSTKTIQDLDKNALVGDIKIEIISEDKVLDLKLSKKLQDSLKWQQILGDIKVVHAAGMIESDSQSEGRLMLGIIPDNKGHAGTLFVGEIKLTELKKKLTQDGYRAEFQGPGVLVCNDKVAVRKQGDGNFVIEGGLDEEFYHVRQTIKSFLAQI